MIEQNESTTSNSKSSTKRRRFRRSVSEKQVRETRAKRRLKLEGLESRQLLAFDSLPPLFPDLPTFDGPRNVGTVPAFTVVENESATAPGQNDFPGQAQVLPLGNLPGQENTIDVTGTLAIGTIPGTNPPQSFVDIDTFAVDLQAGDILDLAAFGAAGSYNVFYGPGTSLNGQLYFGSEQVQNIGLPIDSPIQTTGLVNGAQVIPETGRYFIQLAPTDFSTTYTLGLRTYRPLAESLPVGSQQIVLVDFEGANVPANLLTFPGAPPVPGIVRIPPLRESLPLLGVEVVDDAAFDAITSGILEQVEAQFQTVITNGGQNGDFASTGNPGDFGITFIGSNEVTPEQRQQLLLSPIVSRAIVGGTNADINFPPVLLGVSTTLDTGNFSLDDEVFLPLDLFEGFVTQFPIANNFSVVDAITRTLAATVSHELAHSFGIRHTNPNNLVGSIIDAGGGISDGQFVGAGNDGIIGTTDDEIVEFTVDQFTPAEGIFGFNQVPASLSFALSTGTVGGSAISGRVFGDQNSNGVDDNDSGVAGATVFADADGDGVLDPGEISAVSDANGSFNLVAPPGTPAISVVTPEGLVPTTATSLPVGTNLSFGFAGFDGGVAGPLGAAFVDANGNGLLDPGEGIADAFVFIDLDGDDQPDLGEPNALTGPDGTYNLTFPQAGTFDIRLIPPPGFDFTTPASGENQVTFNGIGSVGNADFILESAQDFGDAPDSFGTSLAVAGASHGIVPGLSLGGTLVDPEPSGIPSPLANSDDLGGIDDEDGVVLASLLSPGSIANFSVTVNNTTGTPAFLQGFADFNGDGDFNDLGEQFIADQVVASGAVGQILTLGTVLPAGTPVGNLVTRFRLSQTPGVGATGFANTGEVEDHVFQVLAEPSIAVDDPTLGDADSEAAFSVSQNSLANILPVLDNDFNTPENPLTIDFINVAGVNGTVVIADDNQSLIYTPANGFIGTETFSYTVSDTLGNQSTATVTVTVTFQTDVPIAVDDSFQIPQGAVALPLNVLDNDVPSISGGLTIIATAPGSAGGTVLIVGGGQSLTYTPVPGFSGTEQFTYTVQDAAGQISTAQVTVNLLPGSQADDVVDFSIRFFDPVNTNTEIQNVQAGDEFLARVFVDDLRLFIAEPGVSSAFVDLLFTNELVSTVASPVTPTSPFPFDITFGPLFELADGSLQTANADTPGLLDEVGGTQTSTAGSNPDFTPFAAPEELFTVRLVALAPGVAQFATDPADEAVSETILSDTLAVVPVSQQRLGQAELVIFPDGDFTSATDDSFPDLVDSNGVPIDSGVTPEPAVLDVLANDNLGATGVIQEFGLQTNPTFGDVVINNNGTPDNLNDDFFVYTPFVNANGFEQFTYVIVTADNVVSTATVTIPLGGVDISEPAVDFDFELITADGDPTVNVGDVFGVQIDVTDLTFGSPTFVFAGFLDVLFDQGLVAPVAPDAAIDLQDFGFGPGVSLTPGLDFGFVVGETFDADTAVGTAQQPGILDEFGTVVELDGIGNPNTTANGTRTLATIFFEAVGSGTADIVGSPADSFPFQSTLIFGQDDPVPVEQLQFDRLSVPISGAAPPPGGGGVVTSLQNSDFPQDVNDDSFVSPIDALLIINQLIQGPPAGEGEFSALSVGSGPALFTDVNGDSFTTPLDALQVINFLVGNTNATNAVASNVVEPLGDTDADQENSEAASDQVFASLSSNDDESLPQTNPVLLRQASIGTASVDVTSDQDDEEETEVLDLLAADVLSARL